MDDRDPRLQSQRINTPRMGEPKESQLSHMNHKILLHLMDDCALQNHGGMHAPHWPEFTVTMIHPVGSLFETSIPKAI